MDARFEGVIHLAHSSTGDAESARHAARVIRAGLPGLQQQSRKSWSAHSDQLSNPILSRWLTSCLLLLRASSKFGQEGPQSFRLPSRAMETARLPLAIAAAVIWLGWLVPFRQHPLPC